MLGHLAPDLTLYRENRTTGRRGRVGCGVCSLRTMQGKVKEAATKEAEPCCPDAPSLKPERKLRGAVPRPGLLSRRWSSCGQRRPRLRLWLRCTDTHGHASTGPRFQSRNLGVSACSLARLVGGLLAGCNHRSSRCCGGAHRRTSVSAFVGDGAGHPSSLQHRELVGGSLG